MLTMTKVCLIFFCLYKSINYFNNSGCVTSALIFDRQKRRESGKISQSVDFFPPSKQVVAERNDDSVREKSKDPEDFWF